MKNLSNSQKHLLQKLLGNEFHKSQPLYVDEKSKCWEIIETAKVLELDKEFINGLESDYNFEFNN